jgi:hypothetical protein
MLPCNPIEDEIYPPLEDSTGELSRLVCLRHDLPASGMGSFSSPTIFLKTPISPLKWKR